MGSQYAIRDDESIYFVTGTVVDWVDVFSRDEYCNIFVDSVNYCVNEKGLKVHGWVLMTNHFHGLFSSKEGFILSAIMRDILKFQSKNIVKSIAENERESRREWMMHRFEWNGKKHYSNTKYKFWHDDLHAIPIYDNNMLDEKLQYIHQNPVRAGKVAEAHHWLYSSAIDYVGGKGKIELNLV